MEIYRQSYSPSNIEKLEKILQTNSKSRPMDYEIKVDDVHVVSRTSDLSLFHNYESFITSETSCVTVLVYQGKSPRNAKHFFILREDYQPQLSNKKELIRRKVQEEVDKFKKDWELKRITEENEVLKEEIEELEAEIEELEEQIEKMTTAQSPLNGIMGSFGASFVENLIKNNPKILAAIPGGAALAGLMDNQADSKKSEESGPEPEVTFKRKEPEVTISDEDKEAIDFVNQLRTQLTRQEFDDLMEIMNTLIANTAQIPICRDLLGNKM